MGLSARRLQGQGARSNASSLERVGCARDMPGCHLTPMAADSAGVLHAEEQPNTPSPDADPPSLMSRKSTDDPGEPQYCLTRSDWDGYTLRDGVDEPAGSGCQVGGDHSWRVKRRDPRGEWCMTDELKRHLGRAH